MPYKIRLGPYHPAFEEPYRLTVGCKGEVIQSLDIEIGFVMRSVELLAQQRNYIQDIVLVEHVCGICSNVHAMTFAMAAENIAEIHIPDRARYIRTILSELERLHSHFVMGWHRVSRYRLPDNVHGNLQPARAGDGCFGSHLG